MHQSRHLDHHQSRPEAYACIHPLAASSRSALRVGAPWPQVADHDCIHLRTCPKGDEGARRRTCSGNNGYSLCRCKMKCRTQCKTNAKIIDFLLFSSVFLNSKNNKKRRHIRVFNSLDVAFCFSFTSQERFELPTVRLEGECSIRLSY